MMPGVPVAIWDYEDTLRMEAEENSRKEPGFLVTSWSCYISCGPCTSKLFFKAYFIESYSKMHHYLHTIKKKTSDNKTNTMLIVSILRSF